jgi:hypothetical protein
MFFSLVVFCHDDVPRLASFHGACVEFSCLHISK